MGIYKISKSIIRSKKNGKEAINYSLRVPGFIADHLDITNTRFGVRVTDEGILYFPVRHDESREHAALPDWIRQQQQSEAKAEAAKAEAKAV